MGQEDIDFYADDLGYVLRKPNITEPVIIENNQTIGINKIIPDIKPIHATYLNFVVAVKSKPRKI